ncbi:unnamed protein product, partial [Mesorhabditis belari]|uniref:Uncharacterized protein n=1 Tax=Mesorhabditis belari TaxID=2138241 RepID=A0AAF3J372_9BILA
MEFCDNWGELRHVVEGLKKKQLIQKPNHSTAIHQLAHIATKMKDEEWGAHAAVCHCEIAQIYAKLNEPNEERKQWEKAANEMKTEEKSHHHNRSRVFCPWTSDASACFSRAIKILMALKSLKLAAMVSLEAAKHSLEVENYLAATEHASRAVRLFEGERLCGADALRVLATAQLKTDQIEALLDTLDQLWTLSMKAWHNSTPMGKEVQKEADIATMLVICNRKARRGRQAVLKQTFENGIDFDEAGWVRGASDSPLTTSEFLLVSSLCGCLSLCQKQLAIDLYSKQCHSFFSPLCKEIFLYQLDKL